jgi:hypothetical protein
MDLELVIIGVTLVAILLATVRSGLETRAGETPAPCPPGCFEHGTEREAR